MPISLRELPLDERIRLVEDIWDSMVAEEEALEVPASHKTELDARLRSFEVDQEPEQDARCTRSASRDSVMTNASIRATSPVTNSRSSSRNRIR